MDARRLTSRCFAPVALAICLFSLGTGWSAEPPAAPVLEAEAEVLFQRKVFPLLKEKCLACHGDDPAKLKSAYDMRKRGTLLAGGESGKPAVVPGKPEQSPFYLAITRQDEDFKMPPKENDKLTTEQVEWIRQWIAGGAPWPSEERLRELAKAPAGKWDDEYGVIVATSGGLSPEWPHRKYKPENLWAYQPLKKPAMPPTRNSEPGTRNPIDAFVGAMLDKLGLPPAPLADRRTLIRRVTYDLIGLPPTLAEVEAFVRDTDRDERAFAKVVERLLASPHYGEQWGRHWLDVARYADSSGFANDYERGNTWRYRDYVIRAFNQDKPYDQFIREQIAGDELWEGSEPGARNPELLIAVGFLRMGPWELTSMEVAKVARQKFLDDVTDSVGQVLLAHPLQCARCHDHKFDPIPTRDYYSLQAVFATTQLAERPAPFLAAENKSGFDERRYLEQRREHFRKILAGLDRKEEAAARQWCTERGLEYIPRAKGLKQGVPEDKLPPKNVGFSVEDYGMERIARKGLERLRWELDRYEPLAFSVYDGVTRDVKSITAPVRLPSDRMADGELERTAILAGGDPFSPVKPVEPGVLSVADSVIPRPAISVPSSPEGRRKALADWIANPQNPLTARVLVNRIWQWHFGQGLAGNPNNFGAMGKKPTHPELLDWLAATFIEQGWSVKAMHRLILASEAYRRSTLHPDPKLLAEKDPNGTSHAVFKPRRLAAEELRDSMLRVSGELNPALGGIPARPEMNLEAALQPRMVMGTFASAWQPSPRPEQRHRRSIYALKIRGQLDPFMEVFNAPTPDLSCEAREASTVTPQVFSLFNSQASYERAVALALRLTREPGTRNPERSTIIQRAYQLTLGRAAQESELQACLKHWDGMTARHRTLKLALPQSPKEVVREAVEENTGEKFRFTEKLEFYGDFISDRSLADVDAETRGLAEVCLVLFNSNEFAYVY